MTTTTPTPEPSPRERGRKTCRAAYMAVISMHHAVDLCELARTDAAAATSIAREVGTAAASLAELDRLHGDICEPDLAAQIQLDDIAAAVRPVLLAAPDDPRRPIDLVRDLVLQVREAEGAIEEAAVTLGERVRAVAQEAMPPGYSLVRTDESPPRWSWAAAAAAGMDKTTLGVAVRRAWEHTRPSWTRSGMDEDGGETCRSILRDALQAPPDDDRPAVALARDLVARIRQGAIERLEAQRYDLNRLMGLPSPIVVAKASAPDHTLPVYYQGSKVGEAEVRSQPERSVIVVVTGEQLIEDMKRGAVEISMSDEGGPALYVRRRPGGFTPRTEVSEVKPAHFDIGAPASGDQLDRIVSLADVYRRGPEETDEELRRRTLGRFARAPGAGRDAGSEDPEVGALIEAHERDTVSRFGPGFKSIQDLRAEAERRSFPLAGFQPGRQLMTAADFKTPEEFEVYRAGADRLPLGILPGSWEGHLLTAMAAMVAAGIERHEVRMAPIGPVKVDAENVFDLAYDRLSKSAQAAMDTKADDARKIRGLGEALARLGWDSAQDPMHFAQSLIDNPALMFAGTREPTPRSVPAPDLAELRAFRQWCADKVNGGVISATSEHLRGQVDAWIKERVDAALRKADSAALVERRRIAAALRERSKVTGSDAVVEKHIAELLEQGVL